MNCKKCGLLIEEGDSVCPNCGHVKGEELTDDLEIRTFNAKEAKHGGQVIDDIRDNPVVIKANGNSNPTYDHKEESFRTAYQDNSIRYEEEINFEKLKEEITYSKDELEKQRQEDEKLRAKRTKNDKLDLMSIIFAAISIVLAVISFFVSRKLTKIILLFTAFLPLVASLGIVITLKKRKNYANNSLIAFIISFLVYLIFLIIFFIYVFYRPLVSDLVLSMPRIWGWREIKLTIPSNNQSGAEKVHDKVTLYKLSKNNRKVMFLRVGSLVNLYGETRDFDFENPKDRKDAYQILKKKAQGNRREISGTNDLEKTNDPNVYIGYVDFKTLESKNKTELYNRFYFYADNEIGKAVTFLLQSDNAKDVYKLHNDAMEMLNNIKFKEIVRVYDSQLEIPNNGNVAVA